MSSMWCHPPLGDFNGGKRGREGGRKLTISDHRRTDNLCSHPAPFSSLTAVVTLRGDKAVFGRVGRGRRHRHSLVSSNQASDFCRGIHSRLPSLPSSLYEPSFPLKYEFWARERERERERHEKDVLHHGDQVTSHHDPLGSKGRVVSLEEAKH